MIGFTNASKSVTYYRIHVDSTIQPISVLPGAVISYPVPIGVVGDYAGNQIYPSSTGPPPILDTDMVSVIPQSITVLNSILVTSFSFYVTTTDGTLYSVHPQFSTIDIYVSNLMRFPSAIIAPTATPLVFAEPSITVVQGYVNNPMSLGELTLTSPFNSKVTLHST